MVTLGPIRRVLAAAAARPGWRQSFELACIVVAGLFIAASFLRLHAEVAPATAPDMAFLRDPNAVPTPAMGWWTWWDQGFYQRAAQAWASGVTDPVYHWYMPSYALLGAAFVRLTPADPFLYPDLACMLGALWLFCGVGRRLLGFGAAGVPVAAALFAATSVLAPRTLWSWVVRV